MPATILIAPPEQLAVLKTHGDLANATAFTDAEALKALDAITRQRPEIVVLEKTFANTSRGAALINRIKADPTLTCELRVAATDGGYSRVAGRQSVAPVPSPAAAMTPAAIVDAPPDPVPLDRRGTRRAPRYRVADTLEVMIDGNPAVLVDVSMVGAMVVSPTSLKPNQRVRVSLPDAARPIRFGAGVAWSAFELPKSGPRYRAGIEFYDADATALERFINGIIKE